MKELRTEVEINSTPERVWAALLESEGIPEPMKGAVRANNLGAQLKVRLGAGGRGATFKMKLLAAQSGKLLRWKGHLWIPGLFDGEHIFEIEPLSDGKVRFIQREIFGGLFLPFLSSTLKATRSEFEAMNRAVKEHAEGIQR